MYLACVLFVVGGWPKSNCHNWTVAKLKLHYIVAYRTTIFTNSYRLLHVSQEMTTLYNTRKCNKKSAFNEPAYSETQFSNILLIHFHQMQPE